MPQNQSLPTTIGGYKILRELGRGGMGVVYRAKDATGRAVAIKKMLPQIEERDTGRERFDREARAMARVISEHTIRILEVGEEDDAPFFVMEYLRGRSLQDYLDSDKTRSLDQILRIALEVGRGLADAHAQGVIHRDLKPDNVRLVAPTGLAKLIDFGLARVAGGTSMTKTGGILGTPSYMSPEQARGETVDYRSDLFSYGVLLYRMLTDELPFRAENVLALLIRIQLHNPETPRQIDANVPEPVSKLVEQLMSKAPEKRPDLRKTVLPLLEKLRTPPEKTVAQPVAVEKPPSLDQTARPAPLDCTGPKLDSESIQRVQSAWANSFRVAIEESVNLGNGVWMPFVLIPPGTFWMGSPPSQKWRSDDEGPQHTVTLTRPFFLSKFAVTQQEYLQLRGTNPSHFKGRSSWIPFFGSSEWKRLPVEMVSWDDAMLVCKELSARRLPPGVRRARLPTEAEWEYACRAGTRTVFHFGNTLNGQEANCNGTSPYGTSVRGEYLQATCAVDCKDFLPNGFGLHQMHGNVREWCLDGWDEKAYQHGARIDPLIRHSSDERILRGGSWQSNPRSCRAAYRNRSSESNRRNDIGFRIVLLFD